LCVVKDWCVWGKKKKKKKKWPLRL